MYILGFSWNLLLKKKENNPGPCPKFDGPSDGMIEQSDEQRKQSNGQT